MTAYLGAMFDGVRISRFVGVSVAILGAGCLGPSMTSRGYPLYAGASLPASKVATLGVLARGEGRPIRDDAAVPIKMVDGVDVLAKGWTFELLPGCHVVELDVRARGPSYSGPLVPPLVPTTFIFPMKAGYSYLVETEWVRDMGRYVPILHGWEQDSTGKQTTTFQPVPSAGAAHGCEAQGNAGTSAPK
jgi:hypothetical protein